jgi:hypothetical protein
MPISRRDAIGDSALADDLRWSGAFGVSVDFIARTHCSVEFIPLKKMQVHTCLVNRLRAIPMSILSHSTRNFKNLSLLVFNDILVSVLVNLVHQNINQQPV